jgi:hypothetical protein
MPVRLAAMLGFIAVAGVVLVAFGVRLASERR